MIIDTAEKSVSLARSIIGLINDIDSLFNSSKRREARYVEIIQLKSKEQNDIFISISREYYSVISKAHRKVKKIEDYSKLEDDFSELMLLRDNIVIDRSALNGAMSGLYSILKQEHSHNVVGILNNYEMYIKLVSCYFDAPAKEERLVYPSIFTDIFDMVSYIIEFHSNGGYDVRKNTGDLSAKANFLWMGGPRISRCLFEIIKEHKALLKRRSESCSNQYSLLQEGISAYIANKL